MGDLAVDLASWAGNELGLRNVPSVDDLRLLCKGSSSAAFRFLVERVRSHEHAEHIRNNLRVQGYMRKEENSKAAEAATKHALRARLQKAQAEISRLRSEIKQSRKNLSAFENAQEEDQQRAHHKGQREALEVFQGIRIGYATSSIDQVRREVDSIIREPLSLQSASSHTVESHDCLNDALTRLSESTREECIHLSGFDEDAKQREAGQLRSMRLRLLRDLRECHVELFLKAEQIRSKRVAAEQLVVKASRSVDPQVLLEAVLQGEKAAAASAEMELSNMRERLSQRRNQVQKAKEFIALALEEENRLKAQREDAERAVVVTKRILEQIANTYHEIEADLGKNLVNIRSELQHQLDANIQIAAQEIELTRNMNLSKSRRIDVGNLRVPRASLSIFARDRIEDIDGLQELLQTTSGADQILPYIVKTILTHENDRSNRRALGHALTNYPVRLEIETLSERSKTTITNVDDARKASVSTLTPIFDEASKLTTSTIPRLTFEAFTSLSEWCEQPIRQCAPWKVVNGATLRRHEERLHQLYASASALKRNI